MPELSLPASLFRLIVTASHQSIGQIAARSWRQLRRQALAMWPQPLPEQSEQLYVLPKPFAFEANATPANAWSLYSGRFRFLNLPEVRMGESVKWQTAPDGNRFWLAELHAFDYVQSLAQAYATTGEAPGVLASEKLILDWIRQNRMPMGAGWAPQPLSRRLVNWAIAVSAFQEINEFRAAIPKIMASLEQQARYLAGALEHDAGGYPLLKNYQALAWVRALCKPYLSLSLRASLAPFYQRYWDELMSQTRADGSHEENSTSYHVLALKDAFETILLARKCGLPLPGAAKERVEAMFTYMISLLQPDGSLPLLNDAVRNEPVAPLELLAAGAALFGRADWRALCGPEVDTAYLRWTLGILGTETLHGLDPEEGGPPASLDYGHREAGYYVMRSGWGPRADYLLFDCGPIGPRHRMAHAHADTLAVILWAHGAEILTDPGVFTYQAGRWRQHFRGTGAHNTVMVDRQDQSEVWGSFRVARYASAWPTAWAPGARVAGGHDGYRRLKGTVEHMRQVRQDGPHRWVIQDELTSTAGKHQYEWTFQFPPLALVSRLDARSFEVSVGAGVSAVLTLDGPEDLAITVEEGWVSRDWHHKQSAPVLKARLESEAFRVLLETEIVAFGPEPEEEEEAAEAEASGS